MSAERRDQVGDGLVTAAGPDWRSFPDAIDAYATAKPSRQVG